MILKTDGHVVISHVSDDNSYEEWVDIQEIAEAAL